MLMNIYLTSIALLISLSNALSTVNLRVNQMLKDSIKNSDIKFYTVKLRKDLNMDVALETDLVQYDQKTKLPIMIISTKQLPNSDRSSQWICGSLGKEKCIVPKDFIKEANTNSLSVGVFCEECEYSLKYTYENNANTDLITEKQNELRLLVSLPAIRLLQEPTADTAATTGTETPAVNEAIASPEPTTATTTATPTTETQAPVTTTQSESIGVPPSYWRNPSAPLTIEDKLSSLRGAGVAGLLFGIMFIICVIIAYHIHIVIFVNTKFMNEPLKLGKIE